MARAFAYPEPEKGGRGNKALRGEDVSSGSIAKARAVLRYSEALADAVMADETSLDVAYEQAAALDRQHEREAKARKERSCDGSDERPMLRGISGIQLGHSLGGRRVVVSISPQGGAAWRSDRNPLTTAPILITPKL